MKTLNIFFILFIIYTCVLPAQNKVKYTVLPAAGYNFLKWSDGNTENPRIIDVSEYVGKTVQVSSFMTSRIVMINNATNVIIQEILDAANSSITYPVDIPCCEALFEYTKLGIYISFGGGNTDLPEFKMVYISGDTYKMGAQNINQSLENYDINALANETPVHNVTLNEFYFGETEITQDLWIAVMGNNPSYFKEGNYVLTQPVEQISFYDMLVFCNKLSIKLGKEPVYSIKIEGIEETIPDKWGAIPSSVNELWNTVKVVKGAKGFRMPTEAEWEYVARGGKNKDNFIYSGSNDLNDVAWYTINSNNKKTYEVKTKSSNSLGIYDMSGNVWEWCFDTWDYTNNYQELSVVDPVIIDKGSDRILRGGSWGNSSNYCRVSHRNYDYPNYHSRSCGGRLVLVK